MTPTPQKTNAEAFLGDLPSLVQTTPAEGPALSEGKVREPEGLRSSKHCTWLILPLTLFLPAQDPAGLPSLLWQRGRPHLSVRLH